MAGNEIDINVMISMVFRLFGTVKIEVEQHF